MLHSPPNTSTSAPFGVTLRHLLRRRRLNPADLTGGLFNNAPVFGNFLFYPALVLPPCSCYSWTRPLTSVWRSHNGFGCDLRPHRSVVPTLNYLDYWTSVTFTALLCIALHSLMADYTIYDDIGHASQLKLELLNWTGLYGGDLS